MSYQGEFGVSFLVLIQWLRTRRKFSCRFFFPAKTSVDLPWEEVPPPSISLDKEVAANKEGIDDDTNAAANAAPDNDDYAATDNDNATMTPTKVKPLPTKPTKKDIAAAAVKPPPPAAAAAAATSFSVDANNPLTENYYADEAYN